MANVQLEQTLIRAPFDGIVLTKNANVGDIITPFSSATDSKGAVVNMADMDTLEVEADVSENSIAKIRIAMPTEIQLDAYPDLRLLGEVSRLVPTVDRSKATLLVKVAFREKDPRALPDMIGAMITMYAAVANRTQEIGTLRALGFRRSSILAAFLLESILLAVVGGVVGLILASFLQAFTVTTMNFQSFSQLAFGFHLTPAIVAATLGFSVAMGLIGGFLPSVRAARLEIVDALRAA